MDAFFLPTAGFPTPAGNDETYKYESWRKKYVERKGQTPFRLKFPSKKRSCTTNASFHGDFGMIADIFGLSPDYVKHVSKLRAPHLFCKDVPNAPEGAPKYELLSSAELNQFQASEWMSIYREYWATQAYNNFGIITLKWYVDEERERAYYGEIY